MQYHSHTESIVSSNCSGFGAGGLMVFGCGCLPSKLLTPLYKETYLLEFETATDKAIVKMNLGITEQADLAALKLQIIAEVLKEVNKNNSGNNGGNNNNTPSEDPGNLNIPSGDNGLGTKDWGEV